MSKQEDLNKLESKMQTDDTLPLKAGATNLVFGVGNPDTDILFIGEGPGRWEDEKGEPFVGNAGALLNQMLYSIELDRDQVYITNVVHHRPPENRDPEPSEMKAYQTYLDGIINIIKPKMIVTLGRFSMGKFLPGVMISNVHGKSRLVDWNGRKIVIMPMYHPAAGLRNGEIKRRLTDDFRNIPEAMKEYDTMVEAESGPEKDDYVT
jgi:uracil-DNA glycosylase family 4